MNIPIRNVSLWLCLAATAVTAQAQLHLWTRDGRTCLTIGSSPLILEGGVASSVQPDLDWEVVEPGGGQTLRNSKGEVEYWPPIVWETTWFTLRAKDSKNIYGSRDLNIEVCPMRLDGPMRAAWDRAWNKARLDPHVGDPRGERPYADGAAQEAAFQSIKQMLMVPADHPNRDLAGQCLVTDSLWLRTVDPAGGTRKLAGKLSWSGHGEGPADQVMLRNPTHLALAPGSGDPSAPVLYISDPGLDAIWVMDGNYHFRIHVGVPGRACSIHQDGPRLEARLKSPAGLVVDPDGTIWFADQESGVIRKVAPDGMVTTEHGQPDIRTMVDGPKARATFGSPRALVRDPATGDLLVSDHGMVRRIDARTGEVSRVVMTLVPTAIETHGSASPLSPGPVPASPGTPRSASAAPASPGSPWSLPLSPGGTSIASILMPPDVTALAVDGKYLYLVGGPAGGAGRLDLETGELLPLVETTLQPGGQCGPLACAGVPKPATTGWAALDHPFALALSPEGQCLVSNQYALFQLILPLKPEASGLRTSGSASASGPATPPRSTVERKDSPAMGPMTDQQE